MAQSIVKVSVTANGYHFDTPWQAPFQYQTTGSGFVIHDNLIVTNAHVVANQIFTDVRRTDDPTPRRARVELVDHDCDLALLKVDDDTFFKKAKSLTLGPMPNVRDEVYAVGFPIGGNELSTTEGVVSRFEISEYVHSGKMLPLLQIDAAINMGNSGGPALDKNNQVIGVVSQSYLFAQNIGYIIPVDVLKHFLKDYKKNGPYQGFPSVGIVGQSMENPDLRKKYGMRNKETGILLTDVSYPAEQDNLLKRSDVILSINDVDVSNNATILLANGTRIQAQYLISNSHIGDTLKFKLLRAGQQQILSVPLKYNEHHFSLVPNTQYDKAPTYYIYAGLVFTPLTQNYLQSFGEHWSSKAPLALINYLQNGKKKSDRQQVILLSRLLPDNINIGYQQLNNLVISSINGQPISTMHDVIHAIESHQGAHHTILSEDHKHIVLERLSAEKHHPIILNNYRINANRSDDLKPTMH